jgi:hypothetical protein
MSTTTVACLRRTLSDYFEGPVVNTAIRSARHFGQIPHGTAGRAGCGSAPIDARQAVLLVLALCSGSWAHPKDGPHEAERLGRFKLLRRDENPGGGEPTKRTPYENQHIDLLTAMVNEIERLDDDHMPSSWNIASNGVCQAAPDRLLFGDSLEDVTDPADVDRIVRQTRIPARLLADIAELFHARCAEAA